jgi:hypothetical protein
MEMGWAATTFTLFLEGELSPSAVGFHCDENCSKSLVKLLRSHGLDVTSAHQARLCRKGDEAHLRYACRSRRVVVTHDVKDFLRLGAELKHAGILLCRGAGRFPGEILRSCLALASRSGPAEGPVDVVGPASDARS